jgi:hypothetical protein
MSNVAMLATKKGCHYSKGGEWRQTGSCDKRDELIIYFFNFSNSIIHAITYLNSKL